MEKTDWCSRQVAGFYFTAFYFRYFFDLHNCIVYILDDPFVSEVDLVSIFPSKILCVTSHSRTCVSSAGVRESSDFYFTSRLATKNYGLTEIPPALIFNE